MKLSQSRLPHISFEVVDIPQTLPGLLLLLSITASIRHQVIAKVKVDASRMLGENVSVGPYQSCCPAPKFCKHCTPDKLERNVQVSCIILSFHAIDEFQ